MRTSVLAGISLAVLALSVPVGAEASVEATATHVLASSHQAVTSSPSLAKAVKVVKFKNCAALNKKFPHGVGRPGAHDRVARGSVPVTNFTRNLAWYRANASRDRDKDGIACEKH